MAVTDLCWIRDDPPRGDCRLLRDEYLRPMQRRPDTSQVSTGRVTKLIGNFTLPESSWRDEYYRPVEEEIGRMRKRYPGNARVAELCEEMEREKDMYRKYSDYYGYVFFVMRKTG